MSEVARVILRHVSPETAHAIASDMLGIPGNQSFRDSIAKLAVLLDTRKVRN